ncbi:MAG TPA: ATP-binding protein [Tissierellaceae bacterium]|nr:ATP-binding protein [Tissierellaceae bacterium]
MSSENIYLKIPSKADYISLARLTSSAIAHNMNLNIEEIEDIKVCVGEACVNILSLTEVEEISITFNISDDNLAIFVKDVVERIPEGLDDFREGELGLLIIRSLMDEVEFVDGGIKMIKYTK